MLSILFLKERENNCWDIFFGDSQPKLFVCICLLIIAVLFLILLAKHECKIFNKLLLLLLLATNYCHFIFVFTESRTLGFYFLYSLTGLSEPNPDSSDWHILVDYPGQLGLSEQWLLNGGSGIRIQYLGLYFTEVTDYINFAEIELGEMFPLTCRTPFNRPLYGPPTSE